MTAAKASLSSLMGAMQICANAGLQSGGEGGVVNEHLDTAASLPKVEAKVTGNVQRRAR